MKSLGQIAYEAYMDFTGGQSLITGHNLPEWDAQTEMIKAAWQAAGMAVAGEIAFRSPIHNEYDVPRSAPL